MKNLDINAMSNAVKAAMSLCGVDVLADVNKFQAAMMDFLHSNSLITEQQLVIFAVRIGVGRALLKAVNGPISAQKRMVGVANALLTEEYGFLKDRSDRILGVFVSALGWQLPSNEHLPSKPSSPIFVKGTVIPFGQYQWRVISVKNKIALLLANEITDIGIPYNIEMGETSWEECSLRRWLNLEFLARFSKEQQNRILKKTVRAENNPWYQTSAGNSTEDMVFLLSLSEVIRKLGDSSHLSTRPENGWTDTTVSYKQSCAIDDRFNANRCAAYKGEKTWWWLRSPGNSTSTVAYVNADGIIFLKGESAFDNGGPNCVGVCPGVRPAIWLRQ